MYTKYEEVTNISSFVILFNVFVTHFRISTYGLRKELYATHRLAEFR